MNARTNPFASRHVESLAYQYLDMPLENMLKRLQMLNYRAAITGPEGSGKTTLLETIGSELRGQGLQTVYIKFDEENRKLPKDCLKQISAKSSPEPESNGFAFLIDGTEQLSWLAWKRLGLYTKKAGAVLITSHAKAPLPTLVNTKTSPELLYGLALKLAGKNEMISQKEINRLFESHNGNIRVALRELYDVWADRN